MATSKNITIHGIIEVKPTDKGVRADFVVNSGSNITIYAITDDELVEKIERFIGRGLELNEIKWL